MRKEVGALGRPVEGGDGIEGPRTDDKGPRLNARGGRTEDRGLSIPSEGSVPFYVPAFVVIVVIFASM